MLGCWEAEPSDRPTFSHLVETLGDLLQERVQQVGAAALWPSDEAANKDKRRCRSPLKCWQISLFCLRRKERITFPWNLFLLGTPVAL